MAFPKHNLNNLFIKLHHVISAHGQCWSTTGHTAMLVNMLTTRNKSLNYYLISFNSCVSYHFPCNILFQGYAGELAFVDVYPFLLIWVRIIRWSTTGHPRKIHESPWITTFGTRVRRFANNVHEWRLSNRFTSDPKSLLTVTIVLSYFLHDISCSEHTIPLKTIIDRWFRWLWLRTVFLT